VAGRLSSSSEGPKCESAPLTGYKARFYDSYYTTHILGRKGQVTLETFRGHARIFDALWAPVLPADKTARILDAGCGSGSLVWWLQQRGYTATAGIDVSGEQVEMARELGVRGVARADLREYLSAHPATFDRLILRDVLEHFPREQIIEVLDLCRGALRPDGALAIQVPNAEAPLWGRIRYGDFTHEMAFTEGALRQLFSVTGYDGVEFHPAGPVLRGPRDLPRHLLWKCVQNLYRMLVFAETGRRGVIVTEGIIALARPLASSRDAG